MRKANKNVRDLGDVMVDEKFIGDFTDKTQGVVIDSVQDRNKRKTRIKVVRTENVKLFAGNDTVCVFWVKGRRPLMQETAGAASL
jgi:hypothetical protein